MGGKLITLEGIDGSGKTTQLELLADHLRQKNLEVITTREPGGTPLGKKLREVFLETKDKIAPRAELLLFAADRSQHIEFLIKPALEQNKIVISDRFADATFAYQGAGRGFSEDLVNEVIEIATNGLKPDLTIFYDLPIEISQARTISADAKDRKNNRMDAEKKDFYERVRNAYLKIAAREPERFIIIEADGTIEEIQSKTISVMTDFLEQIT